MNVECERRGPSAVTAGCVHLLEGRDVDDALAMALAVGHAELVLGGREGARAATGRACGGTRSPYVWDDRATPAVIAATTYEAWRVRERTAKVIARPPARDALNAAVGLKDNPVARVASGGGRTNRRNPRRHPRLSYRGRRGRTALLAHAAHATGNQGLLSR